MKIVVLDGHTLNPGDLSWTGLESFGEVMVYERSTESGASAKLLVPPPSIYSNPNLPSISSGVRK